MDVILIPGLWLDGSSWQNVVPTLERAGHRTHALTLPGMESKDADRSKITLRDHVAAVVTEIDSVDPAAKVVLVGHSAGAAIAYAALDARPDRVARSLYIGGFPTGDGDAVADGYPAENGEVPLPDWSAFEDEELADLDESARRQFRERAIPSPERVTRDPQRLSDERRYAVPATVICPEFTSDQLRTWVARGSAPVRELTRIHQVEYVDLPTGHWPQFTRPDDLARIILATVDASAARQAPGPAAAKVSAREFHQADGVEDWRVMFGGAYAHFRTGSFASGVAFVDAIGRLVDAANHHPEVDLRHAGVTVRLRTYDNGGLSERDVELARRVSAAARELDVSADPGAVQVVQVAIDALATDKVRPFWRAVLGYQERGDEDLDDPHSRNPSIWFQQMDAPRPQRNRLHIDVSVPHDQAESRVAAALAAGGRLVSDAHAPASWTLADPEGNEVDVATWMGRD